MTIKVFGGGDRVKIAAEVLAKKLDELFPDSDKNLIILPIPTTRDRMSITGSDTRLEELLNITKKGDMIAGYGIPPGLRMILENRGALVYDSADDEAFLLENARITAHGALGRILTETERDLSELKVGIIGYGRIGSALSELLLFLGSSVRIYTANRRKVSMLAESGADVKELTPKEKYDGLDILINTAPHRLMTPKKEEELHRRGVKMIELASGKNFTSEWVVLMPSIPDRMYPLSAGRLYAKHIYNAFFGEKNEAEKA